MIGLGDPVCSGLFYQSHHRICESHGITDVFWCGHKVTANLGGRSIVYSKYCTYGSDYTQYLKGLHLVWISLVDEVGHSPITANLRRGGGGGGGGPCSPFINQAFPSPCYSSPRSQDNKS